MYYEVSMYKYHFVFLTTILLFGCGGEVDTPIPTELSLDGIGNKTVTVGDPALNFSLSAFDPDSLSFSFETMGRLGANPYIAGATFNAGTGTFNWGLTNVAAGNYFVTFTVINTISDTDSEEIQITVQAEPDVFTIGQNLYNAECQSCHGPGGKGGSQTIIECIDAATYNATINSGSMAQYASTWSTSGKSAVHFYLNQIDPSRC